MTLSRRRLVKQSIGAVSLGVSGSLLASEPSVQNSESTIAAQSGPAFRQHFGDPRGKITVYQPYPHQVWIRGGQKGHVNRQILSYRAHNHQKYPYFYPLAGPKSGLPLTTETSHPYPHQRSLWMACDGIKAGSGTFHFWHTPNDVSRILSQGIRLGQTSSTTAEILDHCLWTPGGKSAVIGDERRFEFKLSENGNYLIDVTIMLKALTDLAIAPGGHSLFAMRASEDLTPPGGGTLLTSAGIKGGDAAFGKEADWITYFGPRPQAAPGTVEGIALMLHPGHPDTDRYPVLKTMRRWVARDYGFSAPSFDFFDKDLKLAKGDNFTVRYRVYAYAGTPNEANIDSVWREFAEMQ